MRQIKFRFFDLEIQQYRIDGQIQISSSGDPFVIYPLEDKTGFLFEKIENIVI